VRTTSDFPYLIINENELARVLFSVILEVIKIMKKNSGFTALELATALVLIALVAALAMLSYIR
jgi:prepilin-type N-terminal cleavage/methylation domain-containing protein